MGDSRFCFLSNNLKLRDPMVILQCSYQKKEGQCLPQNFLFAVNLAAMGHPYRLLRVTQLLLGYPRESGKRPTPKPRREDRVLQF